MVPVFISEMEVTPQGINYLSCKRGITFPDSPHVRHPSTQCALDDIMYVNFDDKGMMKSGLIKFRKDSTEPLAFLQSVKQTMTEISFLSFLLSFFLESEVK